MFLRTLDGDEPAGAEAQGLPEYISLDGRIWKGVSVRFPIPRVFHNLYCHIHSSTQISQAGKHWIAVEFRKNHSVLPELRHAFETIANDTNRTGLLVRAKVLEEKSVIMGVRCFGVAVVLRIHS